MLLLVNYCRCAAVLLVGKCLEKIVLCCCTTERTLVIHYVSVRHLFVLCKATSFSRAAALVAMET